MFSDKKRILQRGSVCFPFILSALALTFASCAFHEKPPGSTQFNVTSSELSCMDNISASSDRYFNGQASVEEVNAVWDCSSKALAVFTERVKGANPKFYRAIELRAFLQHYYIHKILLTDALMNATGEFKQILVGGANDEISAADILKVQQIFETMRSITLTLRPYFPISNSGIKGKQWKDLSSYELDAFDLDLSGAAALLGNVFQSAGIPYTFAQLSAFIDAIRGSLPSGDSSDDRLRQMLGNIQSHLELVGQTKVVLVSPDESLISSGKDWRYFWSTASSLASVAIKAAWLMDSERLSRAKDRHFPDENLTIGKNLEQIHSLYGQIYSLLQNSVSVRSQFIPGSAHYTKTPMIAFSEIEKLLDLIPSDQLPVSSQLLKTLLEPRISGGSTVLDRLVGGTDFGADGRSAFGLTSGFLRHLDAWFQNWYEGQRFLQELFIRIGTAQSNLGENYLSTTLFESQPALTLWQEVYSQSNAKWNANTMRAAHRIELAIRDVRPLYSLSDSNEVTFPVDNSREAYSLHDLAQKNWMEVAASMMIQGYVEYDPSETEGLPEGVLPSTPPGRSKLDTSQGVNFLEFNNFFQDLLPFGVAIKLFDPDDKKSPTSRFREIDSFTYNSNGDGYMSVDEAITYLGFSFSDFTKAARIHADLSRLCPIKPKADKYGQNLIETQCYRKFFFQNAQAYWDPMATAAKFYQQLSPPDRAHYEYLLEVAARKKGHTDALWMDSGDTQGFVAALQYIEGIYSRYDEKKTGYFSDEDAELAFPVIKRALQQMAASDVPPAQLTDRMAELVFTYMLAKGEVPDTACHKSKTYLELLLWYVQEHVPLVSHFEADRSKIVEIFGALGSGKVGVCGP